MDVWRAIRGKRAIRLRSAIEMRKLPDDDELWIGKRITQPSKSRLSDLKIYQIGLLHRNIPEKEKKTNPPTDRPRPTQDDQVIGNRKDLESPYSVERVWKLPCSGKN